MELFIGVGNYLIDYKKTPLRLKRGFIVLATTFPIAIGIPSWYGRLIPFSLERVVGYK
jgi:hypothetical protein